MGVRRLLGVVAMAFGLLLTSPATSFAQGADDQRLAMANELFELTLGGELRGLFSGYIDEMIAEDPSFEDDHAAWMRANMPALMEDLVETAMARLAPMYAEAMTVEELRYQIEFYRSPLGQSIARKQMELGMRQEAVLTELTEDFLTQMVSKFCAAFDCDALEAERSSKR